MIARIYGKLLEKKELSLIMDAQGVCYEVNVPASVLGRVEETKDAQGNIHLVTYHYLQVTPSNATPTLIGFINEVEKDFFLQFITVSGIGPRAAVKALTKSISEISQAIDKGDLAYLKTLPGIGAQRAKEIVAKLQGKVGRFGLIQDQMTATKKGSTKTSGWQEEALEVLLQLQYKRPEALSMIEKAMAGSAQIQNAEELLNEIYQQRIKS